MQCDGGGCIDHIMPPQDVGDLPHQQAHVIPVEGDLRKLEQGLAAREPGVQCFGRRLDPRRGQATLDAAHRLDQVDLQRLRRRQRRLPFQQGPSVRARPAAGAAIRSTVVVRASHDHTAIRSQPSAPPGLS
jgi:hypothetical protein